ncbi:ABC transporter permease subunit [Paenibacillus sp. KS-LC4]|uniref:ABC transporter permease n=1 Tax=Paenibacillus sp. KS-LC4 TaxID=2979727 RepID=UPI0030D38699
MPSEFVKIISPAKKSKRLRKSVKHSSYRLFFMALPFLILAFLFSYLPLYGWIYAFYDYSPALGISQSPYVGFKWFTTMVSNEMQRAEVIRVLRNTFGMNILGLMTSVFPVIFALFLVEIKSTWYKKMVQILTTLPNFISWVLVYAFVFMLFSTQSGFVNQVLMNVGWISEPINYLASDSYIWIKMTLLGLWKGLGWGAILYIAAIAGIDQELYEAAKVDGAGRFRLMRHVTVPGLIPTFFVLLLLSIAGFISAGFEQFYVFQNAINANDIEVLDLYVYNIGIANSSFSYSTAVSILKSLVSVVLLFIANRLSKMIRGETII